MTISMRGIVAHALVLCCACASSSRADTIARRLSPHRFETESWVFVPAYTESTNLVSAMVAIAKPGAVVGDNLHTVMFLRTTAGWDAYSWRTAAPDQALYTCKMALNIPDSDDDLFGRPDLVELFDPLGARPPQPYLAGMLTDDPLFAVVQNSETPAAFVDMLVDMGYPAAALRPVEGGGETQLCPAEMMMLNSMADTVDWAGPGMYSTDALADQLVTGMTLNLQACVEPEPEDCTPEKITPWATTLVPEFCKWFYIGIRSEPRIDENYRWSCMFELRRYFNEYRSAKFRKADCSEVTCSQKRRGYTPGTIIYCKVSKLEATPPPTCPSTPNCPQPPLQYESACKSEYATIWGDWENTPEGPCP